ncbi:MULTISPECIES: mechanosensitive ion channel family protein [Halomicrobium]|uniref:MscS Mechanosensitive ion channel n=2 Tax=Halomicrobium mukohataei TaxID=57705 RepID=C7NVY4_HALMD|nr:MULTISPECIES: mechanosensitive ion channel family protein [Halomicrobium]ACV48113.1 MscS Mechanosensitive ion channel [Halomicrobium mukohataei DSM 12286]QCD66541.1 mechanosensitive ion channel family protein [Halomicrobium mukohataei]QFR21347.1 mechanosensitive ion channel [Halomicrobium sp. ZPS1]
MTQGTPVVDDDPTPLAQILADFGVPYADSIGQALTFVAVFLAIYLFGRAVILPVVNRALKARDLDAHARKPLKKIVSIAVVFVGISVAFGAAQFGSFLQSLATIAAAATLAIGFAMQDVLSNFVAGIFIFTDKPFRIGDWIEWDDHAGVVEDISLRVTRVRTFDNELLTVPNSQLTDGVIKNPVAKEQLRLKFVFGIGYDDDIDSATEIILDEADEHEGILADPEPSVRLIELGDSSVGLQSRIWIANPSRADFVKIRGEYVKAVKQRFDEAGIDIPYPNRTIGGGLELANVDGLVEPTDDD